MSDRPGALPDLETRMGDVVAVMDAARSERAVLFGYSEGGPMSILYAASHPGAGPRAGHLLELRAAALGAGLPVGFPSRGAGAVRGAARAGLGVGGRHAPHVPERRRGARPVVGRALSGGHQSRRGACPHRDELADRRTRRARRRAGADARAAPPPRHRRHTSTRAATSPSAFPAPGSSSSTAPTTSSPSIRTRSSIRSRTSSARWDPRRRPSRRSPRSSRSASRTRIDPAWVRGILHGVLDEYRGVPALAERATVLATFNGPGRAVRCGLALTERAAAANASPLGRVAHRRDRAAGRERLRRRRRRRPGRRRSRSARARCG